MASSANVRPNLKIRIATPADIPAIIPIVNAAFSVESFLEGTRTDEERMSAMMAKGQFMVGEDASGKIVTSLYVEMRGDRAYLGMLAVDPSLQGSGVGRQMANAAEDYCRKRGARHLDIVVLSLRPELLPLYRKLGFVETGTEEFHPTRPLKEGLECHGIIMTKEL